MWVVDTGLGAAKYQQGTSDVVWKVLYVLLLRKRCYGITFMSPMMHANASDAATTLTGNYLVLIVISFFSLNCFL